MYIYIYIHIYIYISALGLTRHRHTHTYIYISDHLWSMVKHPTNHLRAENEPGSCCAVRPTQERTHRLRETLVRIGIAMGFSFAH